MSLNVGAQTCLKQWISKWESMAEIDGVWDDAIASRLAPTGDLVEFEDLGCIRDFLGWQWVWPVSGRHRVRDYSRALGRSLEGSTAATDALR
jgi:hypothetical protein